MNQELIDDYMEYVLDNINFSMSQSRINMKRLSKLLVTILQLKFHGYENYSQNLGEDERIEKLEKIQKLVKGGNEKFFNIVKFSRIRRAEEFYVKMISKETNPLAKVVVVGLLRAMLKLATLNRGNSSNDKCKFFFA